MGEAADEIGGLNFELPHFPAGLGREKPEIKNLVFQEYFNNIFKFVLKKIFRIVSVLIVKVKGGRAAGVLTYQE